MKSLTINSETVQQINNNQKIKMIEFSQIVKRPRSSEDVNYEHFIPANIAIQTRLL